MDLVIDAEDVTDMGAALLRRADPLEIKPFAAT
jgi:hypothetical protein